MALPFSHSIPSPVSRHPMPSHLAADAPAVPVLPRSTDHHHHKLVISGGGHLSGHVPISGSKNSALAVLAGALCCSGGAVVVRGVPDISDARAMAAILRSLGAKVQERGGGELAVDSTALSSAEPAADEVRKIRAGFFVLGPLVARLGEAAVALPGGHGKVHVKAANGRGLTGGRFYLDYPSVGASETLMMAASMAEGVSVLTNVAQEPEVADLARFLVACGAQIKGVGTRMLVIDGRRSLHGAEFTVIPDRIETGTFMVAAAITRSCVSLSPVIPCHLTSIIDKLSAVGCRISLKGAGILELRRQPPVVIFEGCISGHFPYPGFPTDLQPQFMALLTTCGGPSIVEESVFENRMHHVEELQKLGARIEVNGRSAFVKGRTTQRNVALSGSKVEAADLRGGAALVLAGMAARGVTEVVGVHHIERGYENFEAKLLNLGADISREVIC
ncbi:EPSP synthase (3-phosphoshikimate 1-carboxyvinyltransferase) [Musa troglodytarum]|uniref:UDP-N-acetylglucosamine 1-carboxyvinyltransferase n=1 Tax=Musa troglodytarum TaxID=320322 RepID=A0A9E7EGD5_9LILI|nr:EPSP synthase (3-phosphoshikimate 1-carboxyvinyltransferase) [Musa troglodytarum]